MTAQQVLVECAEAGVSITLADGRLRLHGDPIAQLQVHRIVGYHAGEIADLLKAEAARSVELAPATS